jgi:HD-GYP domain-containing protein (c-di-GMP phosphodiesterase class II)
MNKKRVFVVVSLFCVLSLSLFADSTIGQKYLTAANEQYSIGNLEKAYKYVNSSMKMYAEEPVENNVIFSAQLIYLEYLQQIKENGNMEAFDDVKDSLKEFPLVVNTDITNLIESINKQEIAEVEASASNSSTSDQKNILDAQLKAMKEQNEQYLTVLKENQKAATENQRELLKQLSDQTGTFSEAISDSTRATQENGIAIKHAIASIVFVLVIIVVLVIVFIVISWRNSKKQQERFQATLEMVSRMNRTPNEYLALGAVPDLYDNDLKSAGSSRWGVDALPEPELTEKEINEINELAVECERLGAEIDFATGRKNNSKNVSELVYKLACTMGMNPAKAKIFFCATMVYDAGFLALDPKLLQATELTEDQKYEIRSHVQKGVEKLAFVPNRYKQIFIDAATKHHENLDGTGYPDGLKDTEIPVIARLIHIAEMFTSLISRRNYRGIMDKESAINEIRAEGEAVDQKIVNLLDSII